ncbi:putative carbonic anhydrase [Plasmopara halstedii]
MPTSLERLSEKHKKWCEGKKLLDRIISTRQRKANVCDTCGPVAVPAEEITGFAPVELFIHRNVAKIVVSNYTSALSAVRYDVEHLL